ncbi:MAG: hypothetical protein IE919_19615 [Thioclava sp.]|nr:hypothetical protein [Thioclava sp.]MBD3805417.1 hypothetical protein [Thioclava sp.]
MLSNIQAATPGAFVARLAVEVAGAAADRRAGIGRGAGDRPAPSLAAVAITLADLAGETDKRAERKVPAALACYARDDGRRLVALSYAGALERMGAARGADLSGDRGPASGGVSDGGAAVKVDEAAFVRTVRGFIAGPDGGRVVLPVVRRSGNRRPITALALWDGVICDGASFAEILRTHGWAKKAEPCEILGRAFAEMIHATADRFGFRERVRSA